MTVLVGRTAPDFTAPAVLADGTIADEFTLSEATKGKYAVIFFYPLDFPWFPRAAWEPELVCPAGWKEGDEGMKDTPDGVADYLKEHADEL